MRPFLVKAEKVCFILVATILIVHLGPTSNPALASDMTAVTIHGRLSGPGGTINVDAEASGTGTPVLFAGSGTDSPVNGPPKISKGYCRFPLSGSLSGSVVTLSGVVTFSNVRSVVGTPIMFRANASTGSITFIFGPSLGTGGETFTFTGTGSVVIASK